MNRQMSEIFATIAFFRLNWSKQNRNVFEDTVFARSMTITLFLDTH